jgi:hypothetical protein
MGSYQRFVADVSRNRGVLPAQSHHGARVINVPTVALGA